MLLAAYHANNIVHTQNTKAAATGRFTKPQQLPVAESMLLSTPVVMLLPTSAFRQYSSTSGLASVFGPGRLDGV